MRWVKIRCHLVLIQGDMLKFGISLVRKKLLGWPEPWGALCHRYWRPGTVTLYWKWTREFRCLKEGGLSHTWFIFEIQMRLCCGCFALVAESLSDSECTVLSLGTQLLTYFSKTRGNKFVKCKIGSVSRTDSGFTSCGHTHTLCAVYIITLKLKQSFNLSTIECIKLFCGKQMNEMSLEKYVNRWWWWSLVVTNNKEQDVPQ